MNGLSIAVLEFDVTKEYVVGFLGSVPNTFCYSRKGQ